MVKFCVCACALLVACGSVEKQVLDPNYWRKWGQVHTYGPQWAENERRPLLSFTANIRPPHVLTATLAIEELVDLTIPGGRNPYFANFFWSIRSGVGGAASEWIIDAKSLQQVTLVADTVEISVIARRRWTDVPFQSPNMRMRTSGFIGVGTTSTERATITDLRAAPLPVGAFWDLKIPAGASSFRLMGITPDARSGERSPFVPGVYLTVGGSEFGVQVAATDLLDLMLSGDFIPLPSGSVQSQLVVFNESAATVPESFGILWGVDM